MLHSDKHNSTIQAICKIELTSLSHIQTQNIRFKTLHLALWISSHILFYLFFIINCNQNYLWEKGHCCVRFNDEFPSQREGEGGKKTFFKLKKKKVASFNHKMDLLNSQHSVETLNCMYIQESNQKSIYHSINQMKSYCGEHRTSAVLPGSNNVLRLPSVNNSHIDCLQRLLLSPQAAWRTVFTQFSPAGWIWQSVVAFT